MAGCLNDVQNGHITLCVELVHIAVSLCGRFVAVLDVPRLFYLRWAGLKEVPENEPILNPPHAVVRKTTLFEKRLLNSTKTEFCDARQRDVRHAKAPNGFTKYSHSRRARSASAQMHRHPMGVTAVRNNDRFTRKLTSAETRKYDVCKIIWRRPHRIREAKSGPR